MPTEPHRPSEPRQHVWPIFALAAALLAFGSYFVFFTEEAPPEAPEPLPAAFMKATPVPEVTAPEQPVRLAYEATDRRFELDLRQRQIRGSHSVSTWLRTTAIDTVEEGQAGAPFTVARDYANTRVATHADGAPVGAEIVSEVERLIDASGHRLRMDVTGSVLNAEIASEEAAQVRTLLNLLQETAGMLFVRVPREAVRGDEPWSWGVSWGAAVSGSTNLTARILGEDVDGAVVIGVNVDGAFETNRSAGDSSAFPLRSFTVEGDGWFRWDEQRGGPAQGELHLTRTETLGGEVVTTEYILRLRALVTSATGRE